MPCSEPCSPPPQPAVSLEQDDCVPLKLAREVLGPQVGAATQQRCGQRMPPDHVSLRAEVSALAGNMLAGAV
eukprot:30484-Eustigmatos_ZCMA.PRE.1